MGLNGQTAATEFLTAGNSLTAEPEERAAEAGESRESQPVVGGGGGGGGAQLVYGQEVSLTKKYFKYRETMKICTFIKHVRMC